MNLRTLDGSGRIVEAGIYRDIDSAVYYADPLPTPSFTQSLAKVLNDQSPMHAREENPRLASPTEDDDEAEKYVKAQAIGNAAHKMILHRGKDVEIIDAKDFKGGDAKKLRDEANTAGRVPILKKHMLIADRMVQRAYEQLLVHEDRDAFTNGSGEVMICWQEDGVWFRSLVDWLSHDLRTVDDYKSSGMSMAAHVLGKRAEAGGWHVQAGMIERGLNVLDPDGAGRRRFRFIAQEQAGYPFGLNVMHMNEYWMTFGRKMIDQAIERWKIAIQSGEWECYPTRGITPDFPGYRETDWLAREVAYAEHNERTLSKPSKMLTSLSGG